MSQDGQESHAHGEIQWMLVEDKVNIPYSFSQQLFNNSKDHVTLTVIVQLVLHTAVNMDIVRAMTTMVDEE